MQADRPFLYFWHQVPEHVVHLNSAVGMPQPQQPNYLFSTRGTIIQTSAV